MEEETKPEQEQETAQEADTETEAEAQTEPETSDEKDGPEESDAKNNKFWAVLSYLGVLVLLPLLLKKESPFVQFHAKQGLVLLIGWLVSWLPFGPIIALIVVVLSILGIINVISGEKKNLPVVGELAEKIKF